MSADKGRGVLARPKEQKVPHRRMLCAGLTAVLAFSTSTASQAQQVVLPPARAYDGIQAGLDAFRLAEEQRQANVAIQFGLNEQLRYWPVYAGFGSATIYYSPFAPYIAAQALPARQSIGQWQGQTGPNRWESHPVYAPPLTPYLPLPPVASPWLEGTPHATVPALPPPVVAAPPGPPEAVFQPPPAPKPPRRGPREY
jgi:hypothetical protein